MDNTIEIKKSFWADAAKSGGIIGIVMLIVAIINTQASAPVFNTVIFLLEILALGYFIYYFSRKRSLKYGSEGYTYGQNMGYVFAMMLFTGFILGFGEFMLAEFITPGYYEQVRAAALENNPMYDPDSELGIQMEKMVKSNGLLIFSDIFGMLFYGGIIGLFASAMVKRKPDIFAE